MIKNDLVSIIVPVYKVEKYLGECIESLIAQTYKNIEIILVDDESPDNCGNICDEYSRRDSRIIVIHKKNGGVSDARNTGLDVCKGKFICFVDSDDRVSENFVNTLYKLITSGDYQAVQVGTRHISEDGVALNKKMVAEENVIVNKKELIKGLLLKNINCAVWGNMFKRKVFDDVRFTKEKLNEDFRVWIDAMKHIKNVYISKECLYEYRDRGGSLTNCSMSAIKCYKDAMENVFLCKKVLDLESISLDKEILYAWVNDALIYLKLSGKYDKEVITIIRRNLSKLLKNNYMNRNEKLFVFLLGIFPKLSVSIFHNLYVKKHKFK